MRQTAGVTGGRAAAVTLGEVRGKSHGVIKVYAGCRAPQGRGIQASRWGFEGEPAALACAWGRCLLGARHRLAPPKGSTSRGRGHDGFASRAPATYGGAPCNILGFGLPRTALRGGVEGLAGEAGWFSKRHLYLLLSSPATMGETNVDGYEMVMKPSWLRFLWF